MLLRFFALLAALILVRLQAVQVTGCAVPAKRQGQKILSFVPSTTDEINRIQRLLTKFRKQIPLYPSALTLNEKNIIVVTDEEYREIRLSCPLKSGIKLVKAISDGGVSSTGTPRFAFAHRARGALVRQPSQAVPIFDEEFYSTFRTLEELEAKWSNLQETYPSFVSSAPYGHSLQGRRLTMLQVGRTDKENPKRILLNGLQHAREWIAGAVPTYIAEELARKATRGGNDIARFLQSIQVIIVPVVNPDGYAFSHDEGHRYWRKNLKNDSGCDTFSEDQGPGVDLNRNWGTAFNGGKETSSEPCDPLYVGKAAFSEYETRYLRDLILQTDGIKAHIDFHSFGQVILGPGNYRKGTLDRSEEIRIVASVMETQMLRTGGKQYRFQNVEASGIMSDWVFSQNILSYTVELRPRSSGSVSALGGFELPEDEILATCLEGMAAARTLLEYANNSKAFLEKYRSKVVATNDSDSETSELGKANHLPFIVGVSAGAGVLALIVVWIVIFALKNKSKRTNDAVGADPRVSSSDDSLECGFNFNPEFTATNFCEVKPENCEATVMSSWESSVGKKSTGTPGGAVEEYLLMSSIEDVPDEDVAFGNTVKWSPNMQVFPHPQKDNAP